MAIKRRTTTENRIFQREGPKAVTYDLSTPDCVTITVPVSSRWTSEPHWHETHTEYLQVLQGRAYVRLGHVCREYGSDDGVVKVPRFTVHEWHRTARPQDQQDLIVREWTAPADGQKEVFFRVLNSFLTEPSPSSLFEVPLQSFFALPPMPAWVRGWMEDWIVVLQLFVVFRSWDNWPVLGLMGDDGGWLWSWLSWLATHVVMGVCSAVGHVLGLRGMYSEYVPEELARLVSGERKTEAKTKKMR